MLMAWASAATRSFALGACEPPNLGWAALAEARAGAAVRACLWRTRSGLEGAADALGRLSKPMLCADRLAWLEQKAMQASRAAA